ncbi:3-oxoacyl-ACP synthase III family protein [Salinisphaera sp. Q1T1-3]|uniref:3-oxoacyl-ACP synthase III family protein n=1 Tax=Salinisphaera sp. Q1T1-3 TaxID=2321229 RepID=UPI000E73DA85|nr:ketoacyl-ACP synthase III [Salinisphaera sp. Q1T1-3]RJS93471.1 ketoacyl-ACP synthase III [Salinisphaera sp. Q1T1-3]
MPAVIDAVEYMLPARTESIEEIAARFPNWPLERIAEKTGIRARHVASDDECASDFGVIAAERLIEKAGVAREEIDYLIFTTQTPDYLAPTTACLVQQRLGLPTHIGALDINLGCSGYIYALGVAKALIESGQAKRLLLITADTYSKFVHPGDKSVRALFGDAAAATLLTDREADGEPRIGPFVYGTDGRGAQDLIVPTSGMRRRSARAEAEEYTDRHGNVRSDNNIFMNGRAVVEFTLREVPRAVHETCEKAGITLDDVDAVVPHQASAMVLDGIRERLKLPEEKFVVCMEDIGNTVSCSVPIALKRAVLSGQIKPGALVLLVGFGVGLSWGATLVRLPADFLMSPQD